MLNHRLALVLTTAVLRSKASVSALLGLLLLSASGCNNSDTPTRPTPTPTPTPTPAPRPSVTVTLEGRVLDEHDQPVRGARITLLYYTGGPTPTTTADDTGNFSLTVDWPAHWLGITLRADREGYDSDDIPVPAAEASRAVLIYIYRSLTISPGESIQTKLSLRGGDCGFEPLCRRAIVNSPSGKLVDVEVIPADGQEYVGLALTDQIIWGHDFPRRATVSGGAEVWILVREHGRVTLRAAEH